MDAILELADRLGKSIGADSRTQRMAEVRAAFENRQLLGDYEKQQRKIHELESQGMRIEPDDKRRLADLHAKVAGSEVLKALVKAQADYLELMTTVSQRIEKAVWGTPGSGESG